MKLIKLTNILGQTVYCGGGWTIRPAIVEDIGAGAKCQITYNGEHWAVLEDVTTVVARVEALCE